MIIRTKNFFEQNDEEKEAKWRRLWPVSYYTGAPLLGTYYCLLYMRRRSVWRREGVEQDDTGRMY